VFLIELRHQADTTDKKAKKKVTKPVKKHHTTANKKKATHKHFRNKKKKAKKIVRKKNKNRPKHSRKQIRMKKKKKNMARYIRKKKKITRHRCNKHHQPQVMCYAEIHRPRKRVKYLLTKIIRPRHRKKIAPKYIEHRYEYRKQPKKFSLAMDEYEEPKKTKTVYRTRVTKLYKSAAQIKKETLIQLEAVEMEIEKAKAKVLLDQAIDDKRWNATFDCDNPKGKGGCTKIHDENTALMRNIDDEVFIFYEIVI